MIFVELNNYYINVNHIILIKERGESYSSSGDPYSEIIYGFSNTTRSFTLPGTPKELIESIRKQIKEQICKTPELIEKIENRFKLMDFEE